MKANGDSDWGTDGAVKMTLKADGKLGIGTVSPGEILEVVGNMNISGALKIDEIAQPSTKKFTFSFNPSSTSTKYTKYIGTHSVYSTLNINLTDGGHDHGSSSFFRVTSDYGDTPVIQFMNQGLDTTRATYTLRYRTVDSETYELYFDTTSAHNNTISYTVFVETIGTVASTTTTPATNDSNINECDINMGTFENGRLGIGKIIPQTMIDYKLPSIAANNYVNFGMIHCDENSNDTTQTNIKWHQIYRDNNDNSWRNIEWYKAWNGYVYDNVSHQQVPFTKWYKGGTSNNLFVGIGTTTPTRPLYVAGFTTYSDTFKYFSHDFSGGEFVSHTGSSSAGIYAEHSIWTNSDFVTTSDKRIKKNFIDLNDNESLNLIEQIEVKKYKYKDIVVRGNVETYGFIAQQIENIIPLATDTTTDYIPSIYELGNISSVNGDILVTTTNSLNLGNTEIYGNLSTPLNFRFYDGDDKKLSYNVIQINDTTLQIDANVSVSSGNLYLDNDIVGNIANDKLFIYGPQVDDFKTLNKNKIFTVGISAIQELSRKNTTLESKVTSLENTVLSLQNQLTDVLSRLSALENT